MTKDKKLDYVFILYNICSSTHFLTPDITYLQENADKDDTDLYIFLSLVSTKEMGVAFKIGLLNVSIELAYVLSKNRIVP